jgi:penicillin amidase
LLLAWACYDGPDMEQIQGLEGTIFVRRDELGYPTIEAGSFADGTYGLGYLHARDRLVQVTLLGLAARGSLMSVLGDKPLPRLIDHSVRALGLAADLSEQVAACDERGRRFLENYCAGFNAGAEGRRPLLLRLLGVSPAVFTPEQVVAIFRFVTYFGLNSIQLSVELLVAELLARGAPERLFERLLGDKIRGVNWEETRRLRIPKELSFFEQTFPGTPLAGSNAFAVSGARSTSGGALLMGEFHMEVGRFPPIVYPADVELPDNYLCGMTIPGMAWFAAGRTKHVGWSYTYAHADNVDFLMERVREAKYQAGDAWIPLRRREERVAIKGRPSETWIFHDNDYGSIAGDVVTEGVVPCIRVSGLDQTHRALSAAPRVIDCKSVEELAEVQREVKNASLEAVMVDATGAVASIATGQVDRRPEGWNGVYPRRGWDLPDRKPEPLPEETRPYVVRPESGAVVSANQGGQGPHRQTWCPLPEPLYRFERITELLAKRERHDLASLQAISYDVYDLSAKRLLPVWKELLPDHPLARRLAEWAVEQPRDRELMGAFHALYEEVCFALIAEDLGEKAARRFREWSALAFFQNELDSLLALEQPERLDREELRAVLARASACYLEPPAEVARLEIPVKLRFKGIVTQGRTPAFLGFDSKEVELPGTPVTAFQCRISPISGENLVYAPAFHLAFDMSERGALYNVPGGASESRFGVGYGKGVDEWLAGKWFPIGKGAEDRVRRKDAARTPR